LSVVLLISAEKYYTVAFARHCFKVIRKATHTFVLHPLQNYINFEMLKTCFWRFNCANPLCTRGQIFFLYQEYDVFCVKSWWESKRSQHVLSRLNL